MFFKKFAWKKIIITELTDNQLAERKYSQHILKTIKN